jgi:hypothetical protein
MVVVWLPAIPWTSASRADQQQARGGRLLIVVTVFLVTTTSTTNTLETLLLDIAWVQTMQNCCARKLAGCGNIALRKVVVVGGNNNGTGSGARAASLADLQKLSRSLNQRLQWCWVCDSAKIFLTSKCSYVYFFLTHPSKLKLGLQIGGRLPIAKPPGPIIMMSKSCGSSSSLYYILLWQVLIFAVALTGLTKLWKIAGHKTILLRQTGIVSLFFIEFSFAGSHTAYRWSCS